MLEHAGAYGVLAIILMMLFLKAEHFVINYPVASGWESNPKELITTALIILICGTAGILMEYYQAWFTTTRQMSLHDAVANFPGSFWVPSPFGLYG